LNAVLFTPLTSLYVYGYDLSSSTNPRPQKFHGSASDSIRSSENPNKDYKWAEPGLCHIDIISCTNWWGKDAPRQMRGASLYHGSQAQASDLNGSAILLSSWSHIPMYAIIQLSCWVETSSWRRFGPHVTVGLWTRNGIAEFNAPFWKAWQLFTLQFQIGRKRVRLEFESQKTGTRYFLRRTFYGLDILSVTDMIYHSSESFEVRVAETFSTLPPLLCSVYLMVLVFVREASWVMREWKPGSVLKPEGPPKAWKIIYEIKRATEVLKKIWCGFASRKNSYDHWLGLSLAKLLNCVVLGAGCRSLVGLRKGITWRYLVELFSLLSLRDRWRAWL
jgi:hypothetical protein